MGRPRVPPWNLDAEFAADLEARGEVQPLLDLIGRFSLWVDIRVVRAVPVVYPKTARAPTGRIRQGTVHRGIRYWTNQPAEAAIMRALGSRPDAISGIIVCHVYPGSPYSPRHFTNLANLFIVPRALASFTEWGPVLAALQWHAFELYGYSGPPDKARRRPPRLPRRWRAPTRLGPPGLARVIAKLREARRERPMYSQPRAPLFGTAAEAAFAVSEDIPWWAAAALLRPVGLPRVRPPGLLDLEAQLWDELNEKLRLRRLVTAWVVRHAYFAPPAIVEAVPNPFPLTRRFRPTRGEREGTVVDGVTMCVNKPARAALIVALARSIPRTRGALVDHLWAEAVFLPTHFAHLGGLVIVPRALGTLVDAEPIRAILQRRTFERTGYAGPSGSKPPRPSDMPDPWPENRLLSPKQLDRAVFRLSRYRREIPGFYRKWRLGGPGRRPRGRART
ncbi:MAG TPA: hypothetical protein VJ547_02710 [Candidatus Thermoplasmatota archaeon]|nr:hypothetical protein [Candidatus Thermoplasmatota archaeon]